MLAPIERLEIRQAVHEEMAAIERRLRHDAGSYNYLCSVGGMTFFSHRPVGLVLHAIAHYDSKGHYA